MRVSVCVSACMCAGLKAAVAVSLDCDVSLRAKFSAASSLVASLSHKIKTGFLGL